MSPMIAACTRFAAATRIADLWCSALISLVTRTRVSPSRPLSDRSDKKAEKQRSNSGSK